MKSPLIFLFTRDRDFAQSVREAVSETGAAALIAQKSAPDCKSFGNAGRELDSGLMDFDDVVAAGHFSTRSTIDMNGCPNVVMTSEKAGHASFLAYANGARTCLKRTLSVAGLAKAIADVTDCTTSSASRGPNNADDLEE